MDMIKIVAIICTCIGTLLAAYKFFWKAPSEKETKQPEDIPETVATRLVALFESHGVQRIQIPEFFDHSLDIPTCSSDEELLKKLTPEIITDAVELFGVNKDWLEGSSIEIYDIPDFYKHPAEFENYIITLLKNTLADRLYGYAIASDKKSVSAYYDSLLVIAEPIGELNQRDVYKYHLLGRWKINYWKSRAYFAACCALLHRYGIYCGGKIVQQCWLNQVYEGKTLFDYDFTERNGGVKFPTVGSWMVHELVEDPEIYLKGMATEQGRAIPLAIGKWLDLNEKGYMRCIDGHEDFHAEVEDLFRKKIEKYI